jgi:hypothetical protein
LPTGDVQAIYQRLSEKIKSIKIFDHHADPGFGDDPDVDAQATPTPDLPRARQQPSAGPRDIQLTARITF